MLKSLKFIAALVLLFNLAIVTVGAAGLLPSETGTGNCPKDAQGQTANCGNYSLNDMASVSVNVAEYILGIVGSLALLAFVAGGVMMMLSAGNAEWVTRGKQAIIGAVIGLAIVFTSYTIIYFVYKSLGIASPTDSSWFTSGWFK